MEFMCEECGALFPDQFNLNIHACDHIIHSCSKCGEEFLKKDQLFEHEKMVHDLEEKKRRDVTCKECGWVCSSVTHLRAHIRTHTGEKPFLCSWCGRAFALNSGLKKHILLHTGEKPYLCTVCGKCFRDKSYLSKHLAVHRNGKQFKCQICNRGFTWKAYLKKHVLIHKDHKSYKCYTCGIIFTNQASLNKHEQEYGDQPHEIDPNVISSFESQKSGTSPVKVYRMPGEPKIVTKSKKDGFLQCPYCKKDFRDVEKHKKTCCSSLEHNIKNNSLALSGENFPLLYKCSACHQTFGKLSNLKKHWTVYEKKPEVLRAALNDGGYECPVCKVIFSSACVVDKHFKQHQGNEGRRLWMKSSINEAETLSVATEPSTVTTYIDVDTVLSDAGDVNALPRGGDCNVPKGLHSSTMLLESSLGDPLSHTKLSIDSSSTDNLDATATDEVSIDEQLNTNDNAHQEHHSFTVVKLSDIIKKHNSGSDVIKKHRTGSGNCKVIEIPGFTNMVSGQSGCSQLEEAQPCIIHITENGTEAVSMGSLLQNALPDTETNITQEPLSHLSNLVHDHNYNISSPTPKSGIHNSHDESDMEDNGHDLVSSATDQHVLGSGMAGSGTLGHTTSYSISDTTDRSEHPLGGNCEVYTDENMTNDMSYRNGSETIVDEPEYTDKNRKQRESAEEVLESEQLVIDGEYSSMQVQLDDPECALQCDDTGSEWTGNVNAYYKSDMNQADTEDATHSPPSDSQLKKNADSEMIGAKVKDIPDDNNQDIDPAVCSCNICGEFFRSTHLLLTHVKTHRFNVVYKCGHCGHVTETGTGRGTTKATKEHGRVLRQCPKCQSREFTSHRRVNILGDIFSCNYCSKSFAHRTLLARHLWLVHSVVDNGGRDWYTCEVCPKVYKQPFSLRDHMKTHENKIYYKCTACDIVFDTRMSLGIHIKTHKKGKVYICAMTFLESTNFPEDGS